MTVLRLHQPPQIAFAFSECVRSISSFSNSFLKPNPEPRSSQESQRKKSACHGSPWSVFIQLQQFVCCHTLMARPPATVIEFSQEKMQPNCSPEKRVFNCNKGLSDTHVMQDPLSIIILTGNVRQRFPQTNTNSDVK